MVLNPSNAEIVTVFDLDIKVLLGLLLRLLESRVLRKGALVAALLRVVQAFK